MPRKSGKTPAQLQREIDEVLAKPAADASSGVPSTLTRWEGSHSDVPLHPKYWYAVDQGTYHITPVSNPDRPRDVRWDLRFNKKPLGWEKIGAYHKTLRQAVSAAQRHYAGLRTTHSTKKTSKSTSSTPQKAQSFVIREDIPMGAWSSNKPVFRAFYADGTPLYMADTDLESLKRKIREYHKVKTIKVSRADVGHAITKRRKPRREESQAMRDLREEKARLLRALDYAGNTREQVREYHRMIDEISAKMRALPG